MDNVSELGVRGTFFRVIPQSTNISNLQEGLVEGEESIGTPDYQNLADIIFFYTDDINWNAPFGAGYLGMGGMTF